ncbi:hypothetical protein GCM10027517_03220 [Phycicoccus ginsengisoli]
MSKHVAKQTPPKAAPHTDKYARRATQASSARRGARLLTEDQEREAQVRDRRLTADAENEEILASLPGGTPNERIESARRGLLQNQDSIQNARKDDQ